MFFIRAPELKSFPLRYFIKHKWFKRKMRSFSVAQAKVQTCKVPSSIGYVGIWTGTGIQTPHSQKCRYSVSSLFRHHHKLRILKKRQDPRDQGCLEVQQRSKQPSFWGTPQLPSLSLQNIINSLCEGRRKGDEGWDGGGQFTSCQTTWKQFERMSTHLQQSCLPLVFFPSISWHPQWKQSHPNILIKDRSNIFALFCVLN